MAPAFFIKKTTRMKRILIFLFFLPQILSLKSQDSTQAPKDPALHIYRAMYPHINDLVHTKLDVRFDYSKSYLYGKAWITLKPHFYPTDTLSLDAKGMDLHQVSIFRNGTTAPLKYSYDGMILNIQLDKTYLNTENY